MQGEWLRKSKSEASVVFVHGFLSDGEACWRHESGSYWPQLLMKETDLEGVGIYVYSYQTDIFSGTYQLGDIVDDLKERMKLDYLFNSKRIIFVCHSMGGIVVRKFLVERYLDLMERNIDVRLFLVASPSLGSSYANQLAVVAKVFGNSQAHVLRFSQNNAWLNDLDKEFQNLKQSSKGKIDGKELIEDKFIVFKRLWSKQVVEPFSGSRYFGDPYKVPHSNHFSIAKPANKTSIQHRLLCQFIRDFLELEPAENVEIPIITSERKSFDEGNSQGAEKNSFARRYHIIVFLAIASILIASAYLYFRHSWAVDPCKTDQATLGCP
jgi:hypothetical protein